MTFRMLRSSTITFFARSTYRKEILTVILIKILALILIWTLCFSQPESTKVTSSEMAKRFIAA